MKTMFLICSFVLMTPFLIAQSMSDELWEQIQPCYKMFEEEDGSGDDVEFEEFVDDAKNGYLKVAGSYPTCGCYCETTAGAFKDAKGNYTFISEEIFTCEFKNTINASRDLVDVFPSGFGFTSFAPVSNGKSSTGNAGFYLDIEIPRHGTDTKVTIKPIVFGKKQISKNILSVSGVDETSEAKEIGYFVTIFNETKNKETITHLLEGNHSKIDAADKKVIDNIITDMASYQGAKITYDIITKQLKQLKERYDQYNQIKYESLTLGWDKKTARFYIKEKGVKPKTQTFSEFVFSTGFWLISC